MKHWKAALAASALLLALGLYSVGMPTLEERIQKMKPQLDKKLASRTVHIDPAELENLIYNANFGIHILDLRSEADFNLFHILDAKRVTLDQFRDENWVRKLPGQTVFVLVSNGEKTAEQGYRILAASNVPNLYILDGGINHWLEVFGPQRMMRKREACGPTECRLYRFDAAMGERQPESDPGMESISGRTYQKKVTPIGRTVKKAGGCG